MDIYTFLSKNKDATVGEIVEYVGLTQPTVSYHLREMKENGILSADKKGKEVYYSINGICPHFATSCVLQSVEIPGENYEQ
jgi:DNA-binding transcriptional ArsR family regulator